MKRWLIVLSLYGVAQAHTVILTWHLSTDPTPKSQSIYRSEGCTGVYVRRAVLPNYVVEWTDKTLKNGATYCYYVTVTDENRRMSEPSNVVEVTIP